MSTVFTKQNVNVIYGKPATGKSVIVRKLVKEEGGYSFSYNNRIVPEFCNKEHISKLYTFLSGKKLPSEFSAFFDDNLDNVQFDISAIALLQFCYELSSIVNMEEPFKLLIFDGVPSTFDDEVLSKLLFIIEYLKDNGYTIYFVTSKLSRLEMFKNRFKDELGEILT